jgi:hypothetical protein
MSNPVCRLNEDQLNALTAEERDLYLNMDDEEQKSFEYFYGYAHGTVEQVVITNEETKLYREMTDTIPLKTVCKLTEFVPHLGQQPIIYTFDEHKEDTNSYVFAAGRRTGKTVVTSVIALRELLVPFSSTIILTPTFANAKVMFNEVLKRVQKLNLPIKSINKGQFQFTLENGSRLSANSEMNVESSLGSFNSLLLVDEAQSINSLDNILKQMLMPTLLDYGTRDSGILYGRIVILGTFRGTDNVLYDYYTKEEDLSNWKSYTSPSMMNPTLPKEYFEQMKLELGEMLYNQEILAIPVGHDNNVFYAFTDENIINMEDMDFSSSDYIVGLDIGWSDSTAAIWIYRETDTYYVFKAYSESNRATADHVKSYKEVEEGLSGTLDMRYGDPAAAQTLNDLIITYDYDVSKAKNSVDDGIKYVNQLLTPTGANHKPKLYIDESLTELIRQIRRVKYRNNVGKTSKDPFIADSMGTHWDLLAALRYALYSDKYNMAALNMMQS